MCMNVSVFFVCPLLCTTAVSTHVRAHAEITRTPLSCGGDECDADSLSLLRQSYIQTSILCVCIYIYIYLYICCLFAFLSILDSCLPPNSLLLLDTGGFLCTPTSRRPFHPAFLPGFHRFSECVFLVAVYRALCFSVSVECVCVCVRMSVYDSCLT